MRRLSCALVLAFIIIIWAPLARAANKYDIKSGVITRESLTTIGKSRIKVKQVIYFDDYGMKERNESYGNNGKLGNVFLSDGKNLYTLNPRTHKAYRRGTAYRGTELRVDFNELGTQKQIKAGWVKRLPTRLIAGQVCEMFEIKDAATGAVTQYGGWKHALVYMHKVMQGMTVTLAATRLEANVPVAPEKFEVPAGYTRQ